MQPCGATGSVGLPEVVDLLHAATAIVHGATVLHYDSDFEGLARVDGRLAHSWVVPRGSVD